MQSAGLSHRAQGPVDLLAPVLVVARPKSTELWSRWLSPADCIGLNHRAQSADDLAPILLAFCDSLHAPLGARREVALLPTGYRVGRFLGPNARLLPADPDGSKTPVFGF